MDRCPSCCSSVAFSSFSRITSPDRNSKRSANSFCCALDCSISCCRCSRNCSTRVFDSSCVSDICCLFSSKSRCIWHSSSEILPTICVKSSFSSSAFLSRPSVASKRLSKPRSLPWNCSSSSARVRTTARWTASSAFCSRRSKLCLVAASSSSS